MNRSKYHLIELSERYCIETNRNEEKRILLISFILILLSIKFTNLSKLSNREFDHLFRSIDQRFFHPFFPFSFLTDSPLPGKSLAVARSKDKTH